MVTKTFSRTFNLLAVSDFHMKRKLNFSFCQNHLVIAVVAFALAIPSSALAKAKNKEKPKEASTIGEYTKDGVDVVQGRVFRKRGRHEFSLMGGVIPNNQFLMFETLEARYAYHFREGIAFEVSGTKAWSQEKAILEDLATIPCPSPNSDLDGDGNPEPGGICPVTLQDQPDPVGYSYFGNLIWSPIYGKFALFSKKILHFDIYILAGAGMFDNQRSRRFAFDVGFGTRIFVNDWFAVRAEFKNITVREEAPFSHIVHNRSFGLGVSFFLPTSSRD